MPPPERRWRFWLATFGLLGTLGLLIGAVWGLAGRSPVTEASKEPEPGPTETIQVPLTPGAEQKPEDDPGRLLRPAPTMTVTEHPESGPDGRKEVVPSGSGGSDATGGSPDGGADGEPSVAPSQM